MTNSSETAWPGTSRDLAVWAVTDAARRHRALGLLVAAGLALRAVAQAEALIVPARVYVAAVAGTWRTRPLRGAVLTFCFVLPVLGYMGYSAVILHYGFELSSMGDAYLYGRTAHAADRVTLRVPAVERPLCPTGQVT